MRAMSTAPPAACRSSSRLPDSRRPPSRVDRPHRFIGRAGCDGELVAVLIAVLALGGENYLKREVELR